MPRRGFILVVLAVLCLLASATVITTANSASSEITGTLHIVWPDTPQLGQPGAERYFLYRGEDRPVEILLAGRLAERRGALLPLNRRPVNVTGALEGPGALRADAITPASPQATDGSVMGPQPWVSVLCKFSDVPAEGQPLSYFINMYGSAKPGLDHYWREQSYDKINVSGSTAVGWYTLPRPRSYYVYDQNGDGQVDFDHARAMNDCTQAADAAVYFPSYVGINLMFNGELDGYAWGGSATLTRDGVTRTYYMTWEPPWGWGNQSTMAHEMGHGFGMPHSSGRYGQTYDNHWDVMSDAWANCGATQDPTYGCVGQHTIGFHKQQIVGWIAAERTYTAHESEQTITLERVALPQTADYLVARIPVGGSATHFYTVEARRKAGYDLKLLGEGVIIHEVDQYRSNQAQVIDADGNGNTSDAGAVWTIGETFTDGATGISVSVDAATATGYRVTIHTEPPDPPAVLSAVEGGQFVLRWQQAEQPVDHFEVYRGTTPYFDEDDSGAVTFEVAAPGPGGQVQFVDGDAFEQPLVNYTYFVEAVYASETHSGPSNRTGTFSFALAPGG